MTRSEYSPDGEVPTDAPAPSHEGHGHVPVLLEEILDLLAPTDGEVVADATLGRGGHAVALGARAGATGRVIGTDLDADNLAHTSRRLHEANVRCDLFHDSFVRLEAHVRALGLTADVVLADLGFASNQMDDPDRGMSFREDGPLDMRLDRSRGRTAAELLASWSEVELADAIYRLGEEPLARRIARKLVQHRAQKPIETTAEVVQLVREAYGSRAAQSRQHPATRTFMALRIAVNSELEALDAFLGSIGRAARGVGTGGWLSSGARVGIISFHSLEDRLVKRAFAELGRQGLGDRLTKRPVMAGAQEVQVNARSRSAKLRVFRLASEPSGGSSNA